jgi:hypothetical protein
MRESEKEWTTFLEALNDAAGWSELEELHGCSAWTFGSNGEIGYPLSLISEAVGVPAESLASLYMLHGYSMFCGLPCDELQAMWGLLPGVDFPAVDLRHLPFALLYAGLAIPRDIDKEKVRAELRDKALMVILEWGKTEQGAKVIGPYTFAGF